MNIVASKPAIEGGISWRPDLMLLDARSLDVAAGSALIGGVCQEGVQVCVIDAAGNTDRSNAWLRAGTSALIDNGEPFDELFRDYHSSSEEPLSFGARGKALSLSGCGAGRGTQAGTA